MAYTAPPTVATGDTWTAAMHNTYIIDNLREMWKYTTAGDIVVAASASTARRVAAGDAGDVLRIIDGVPAFDRQPFYLHTSVALTTDVSYLEIADLPEEHSVVYIAGRVLSAKTGITYDTMGLQLNDDSGSNYHQLTVDISSSALTLTELTNQTRFTFRASTVQSAFVSPFEMYIPLAARKNAMLIRVGSTHVSCAWNQSGRVTKIKIFSTSSSVNVASGTVLNVYGIG